MPATKKRVLCIDGNENITSMLSDLLTDLGHDSLTAPNAQTALRLARADSIDLYITETRLPDATGAELTERIREFAPHAPVIFYSNDPHRVALPEAQRAGAQACISKLDDIDLLADAVRLLLK